MRHKNEKKEALPNEENIIMDEFTLIYDNIVMALEMEQIDKVNVSTRSE